VARRIDEITKVHGPMAVLEAPNPDRLRPPIRPAAAVGRFDENSRSVGLRSEGGLSDGLSDGRFVSHTGEQSGNRPDRSQKRKASATPGRRKKRAQTSSRLCKRGRKQIVETSEDEGPDGDWI
jgi:hypothetical protein